MTLTICAPYLRPLWARVLAVGPARRSFTTLLQLLNPQVIRYLSRYGTGGHQQVTWLLVAAALVYLAIGFAQQGVRTAY